MYQKPNFVKVSLKVSDIFANYGATGCPQDEETVINWTIPCDKSDPNYSYSYQTYTGMGYAHQCYSSLNP